MTTELTLGISVTVRDQQIRSILGGFGANEVGILTKDISNLHGTPVSEINRRINENLSQFDYGVDYIDLKISQVNSLSDFGYLQMKLSP